MKFRAVDGRLRELVIADARGGQAYEHLDMTALHDQVTRWREAPYEEMRRPFR